MSFIPKAIGGIAKGALGGLLGGGPAGALAGGGLGALGGLLGGGSPLKGALGGAVGGLFGGKGAGLGALSALLLDERSKQREAAAQQQDFINQTLTRGLGQAEQVFAAKEPLRSLGFGALSQLFSGGGLPAFRGIFQTPTTPGSIAPTTPAPVTPVSLPGILGQGQVGGSIPPQRTDISDPDIKSRLDEIQRRVGEIGRRRRGPPTRDTGNDAREKVRLL